MRKVIKVSAVLGGLSLSLISSSALAGNCGYGVTGPNCAPSVVTHPAPSLNVDPMHVYANGPMGHLRTVQYLGTPSVNITRVHGTHNAPMLSDAPSGFTGGCTPESTQYCRQSAPTAMPQIAQPVVQQPYIATPAPQIVAPQPTERIVAIGGGYDPSKFIPRTYGSNELTPGIAHIPTSIVDRSHANATAVLNGGMTQPQPIVSGGTVPHPSMMTGSVARSVTMPPTMSRSITMPPTRSYSGGNVIGSVSNMVPMAPQTNVYPGSMNSNGTYYEKVSGPTTMGGMQATQVICARQAPQVRVQSPIIGVPSPVPTPVPSVCQSVPVGPMAPSGRYGGAMPSQQPMQMNPGGSRGFGGSTRYGH